MEAPQQLPPGITRHGNKYLYDVRIDGVRHKARYGDPWAAHDALRALRENPDKVFVPNKVKLLDYANEWLRTSKLKKTTKSTYRSVIDTHLVGLHHRRVNSITIFDVRKLVEDMESKRHNGKPYAPLTIRSVLGCLSKIMGRAVADGILGANCVNPVKQLDSDHKPRTTRLRKIRILEPEEIGRLLDTAGAKSPKWKAVFALALFGGLRRGEIMNLRWHDVDFKEKRIRITGDVKTEASDGTIGMSPTLYEIMRAWQDAAEFKFGNDFVISTITRRSYHQSVLSRQAREIMVAAGLDDLQLHHLRHNLASALIWTGASDMMITLQMRHANTGVTRAIYEHIYRERESREEATAAIERAFGGVWGS
jgi:integrase